MGVFSSDGGKATWRRPAAINRGDWDENWTRIFGSRPAPDPEAEAENDQPVIDVGRGPIASTTRPSLSGREPPNMSGGPDCQCPGCIQRRSLSD